AGAIVWEPAHDVDAPLADVPCVAVERLAWHVGEIAARFYDDPANRMFVAGVTGTDGKTSTAHLVAQALEHLGRPCAYLGTLGTGRLDRLEEATHTTPDPIALQARLAEFVDAGIATCAMEVSSHALDQNRIDGIAFDAVVLTNLTRDHLDYHRTVEHYAAAKRRLFEVQDGRALILNRDDPQGAEWIAQMEAGGQRDSLCVYGLDGARPATPRFVVGRDLVLHEDGVGLRLETQDASADLRSRLLGRFNAYNLLAATAVLIESGTSLADAVAALAACGTVPGRIEGFQSTAGGPLVVVDYAHTPKALEQVLQALRAHVRGRLICVFGCGGDRDAGKRPLMGAAAARLADRVFVTDDNPRSETPSGITDQILAGIEPGARAKITVDHDRGRAIRTAVSEALSGDVVLVAGKGHETTQTYGHEVRDFSDRAFVAGLLGGRA
ncbi:MAG: UDP-N-acetylmuramoyl-L-alanyl-D-glutamate--2,6-diaminopimelate ligase, partial [Panacagrimonas sp.]